MLHVDYTDWRAVVARRGEARHLRREAVEEPRQIQNGDGAANAKAASRREDRRRGFRGPTPPRGIAAPDTIASAMATTPPLDFAPAVRPTAAPAHANAAGVGTNDARNVSHSARTLSAVTGTSVRMKCDSRTCSDRTASCAAAINPSAGECRSRPTRHVSQTVAVPISAVTRRPARRHRADVELRERRPFAARGAEQKTANRRRTREGR